LSEMSSIFIWFIHILGFVYEAVMIIIGILTLVAGKKIGDKKTQILGMGFLLIGCGDASHTIGHVLADLIPTPEILFIESTTTAISVSLATVFFLTIRLYASLARTREIGGLDIGLIGLTVFTILMAFLTWTALYGVKRGDPGYTYLIATRSLAVIGMTLTGYIGAFSFIRMARARLREANPILVKRYRYAFRGMLLMVVAITLVFFHPFLIHYPGAMFIVTVLKISALLSAALLTYLGIVGPSWFVRRL